MRGTLAVRDLAAKRFLDLMQLEKRRPRAISLVLALFGFLGCSGYLTGGPAKEICFTIRIDFGGPQVHEDWTIVKGLDLATGSTVFSSSGSAWYFNRAGGPGGVATVRECGPTSSTGTKKFIAFYRPGQRELRPECKAGGNLDSNICMPGPGDVVAETYVDIADGDDLTVDMTMDGVER